jgi:hypothetical protein
MMRKKLFTKLFISTVLLGVNYMSAQVGINTTTPVGGSMLDITSTDKGILIPRVDIADLSTIAPITGGAPESLLVYNTNGTTGKGFYYWNGAEWTMINFRDGDFYETGTTTVPSAITDDVYRTGKMAIGRDATNSKLDVYDNVSSIATEVEVRGSIAGATTGIYVDYNKGITDSGSHFAMRTYLRGGAGTGDRHGLSNDTRGGANTTGDLYGVKNVVRALNTSGTYDLYGTFNRAFDASGGTHQIYGTYNELTNPDGNGEYVGTYNRMEGHNDRVAKGVHNYFSSPGDGEQVGFYTHFQGTGSAVPASSGIGDHKGVYNQIYGGGDLYGMHTILKETASGQTAYGTYADIDGLAGSTNYGNYFKINGLAGSTNYGGYFDVFGTGTNYAAVFYNGAVVANESGNDNDFRIEGQTDNDLFFVDASTNSIGIGTNTPTEKLHVIGNILATGTITPDYVFESYYQGNSKLNPNYEMFSLEDIETYTKKNNHLPGVPSAAEVKEQGGILVNRATEINLEKVEELFLYAIEANKNIKELQQENTVLKDSLKEVMNAIRELEAKLNKQKKE